MVSSIVLPIKKVTSLVDSKIAVEIKDEGCKFEGTLLQWTNTSTFTWKMQSNTEQVQRETLALSSSVETIS